MTANQCLPSHITLAKQTQLASLPLPPPSTHAHWYKHLPQPDAEITNSSFPTLLEEMSYIWLNEMLKVSRSSSHMLIIHTLGDFRSHRSTLLLLMWTSDINILLCSVSLHCFARTGTHQHICLWTHTHTQNINFTHRRCERGPTPANYKTLQKHFYMSCHGQKEWFNSWQFCLLQLMWISNNTP